MSFRVILTTFLLTALYNAMSSTFLPNDQFFFQNVYRDLFTQIIIVYNASIYGISFNFAMDFVRGHTNTYYKIKAVFSCIWAYENSKVLSSGLGVRGGPRAYDERAFHALLCFVQFKRTQSEN